MNKRRRWLLLGAALVVPALLVIVPALLLDVEQHRGRIEQALREATGWKAELGAIDLSVLGGLALTVSPARLEAPDGSSSFEVGDISVRARILPLFRGRLVVERVELLRPDIRLVRPDAESGWVLPLPGGDGATASGATEGTADSSSVTLDRIVVADGALRFEDRTVTPALSLAVEDVDVDLRPATGAISGSGSFGGDGGRIRWKGSLDGTLGLRLENVPSDALAPWLGQGVLHPGGRLGGEIEVDLPTGIEGTLTAESLRVLAGDKPLPATELEFRLSPSAAGWNADHLELRSGPAKLQGSGTLLPLSLDLRLPSTPLATVLELSDAAFPLGLDVTPPGSAELRVGVDMTDDGELTYEAEGDLSAARFVAAELLPPATDVRASFALNRAGTLELRILEATVGGGPLDGTVRIDSIDPLGTLVFDGKVSGASLGTLLGGFVGDAPERVTGPTAVSGRIAVDLGAQTLDASSLGGALTLGSDDVSLAGWDLEGAFREALRDKLGKLADVAALVDSGAAKALGKADPERAGGSSRQLLDRMAARISFDALPWGMRAVELHGGGVAATGSGSFDPLAGTVELQLDVELDEQLTRDYISRNSQLRSLVNDRGRLSLPMRLRGPMTGPRVELDLGKLVPGAKPEEAVKGLLEGFIKKKLDR